MRKPALLALTLTVFHCVAQTGPGGVGSSTNNVLWLSADKSVYSNAGTTLAINASNVQQWNDRSGNGKNASEGTTSNRPNYYTNVLNGQPVIRYTASNNDRLLATGLSTGNQASIWVVASYSSLPSSNPGLIQGAATGNGFSASAGDKNIGMWLSNANQPWGRGIQSNGTQVNIPTSTTTAANTFYLINNSYDGSNITQYINNAASGSVAYNGTLGSWTDMAIGVQAGSECWNGDIAEVIAYNTALNSAQRLILANHLAAKYGLSLTTGDCYSQDNGPQGNFDFEVAGIGRVNATNVQTDSRGSGLLRITKNSPFTGLGDDEFMIWGHNNGTLGTWGVTDKPSGVQGRWARVWRISERNAGNTATVDVGAVDVTFDLTGFGTISAGHLRLLVDTDNDGLFNDETPISGAALVSGALYRFSGVTALANNTRFTLGTTNITNTPLPIELISFEARDQGDGHVRLDWATASEQNNEEFTVERSFDGYDWQDVVKVPGAVNSTQLINYSAVDANSKGPVCYYRLRQTDLDGTSTLSEVVAVELPLKEEQLTEVYPNPSTGPFTVAMHGLTDEVISFSFLDPSGRELPVAHHRLGSGLYEVDPGPVGSGTYILRAMVNGERGIRTVQVVR